MTQEEMMEAFKLGSETSVNRTAFEQLIIAARQIPLDWDFSKKFRVVLEHNPDEKTVTITYSPCV